MLANVYLRGYKTQRDIAHLQCVDQLVGRVSAQGSSKSGGIEARNCLQAVWLKPKAKERVVVRSPLFTSLNISTVKE
jgi:hypothetical protein